MVFGLCVPVCLARLFVGEIGDFIPSLSEWHLFLGLVVLRGWMASIAVLFSISRNVGLGRHLLLGLPVSLFLVTRLVNKVFV